MNILQLTAHFFPNVGGVETHLSDLVSGLANRGINVTVLTYQPLTTKAEWKIIEKHKNIYIFRIPWFAGFFYQLVHFPALEFLYLFPGLFIAAPYMIITKKIDVIHAHGLVAGTVSVIWGKVFGKRVIVTTHSIYNFPQSGAYSSFVRWMFRSGDHILCLSHQSKEEIVKLAIEKNKVSVFTYWINQEIFQKIPNAKKTLKWKTQFTVLFVGRLVAEKGLRILLDAQKDFNSHISLIIAGIGPLENEVKNAMGKNKNIHFLGNISQKDLPIYYSASDLLIVPSIHEEGFGRVIIEALSCGLPVIAADRGGIREALDGSVGQLIEINSENISKNVNALIKNSKKRQKMSQNAIDFAKRYYSEDNLNVIIKTYEEN